jgi:hypothetical protein
VLVTLGMAYFLVKMPFQISDLQANLLLLREHTLGELLRTNFAGGPYFRPFLWGVLKVVFDASGGHYYAVYKAVEVFQVGLLLLLFARLMAVRTRADFVVVPFAFTVLVGMHTFSTLVVENYPINHFLSVSVYVLAVINLAESKGGWLVDVVAVVLLALAMLTLESGLLAWVAIAAAYLARARGVSTRGFVVATALLAAYFYLRFAVLGGGTPGLDERSSGWWFRRAEPSELQAMFGANATWFHAYNVLSSFAGILFAEPRMGVWIYLRALVTPEYRVDPWMTINVVSSTLTSLVIIVYSVSRLPRWIRRQVEPEERLVIVFWAVAMANAVLSYAYTKELIISVAGCVYPLVAFVAVRNLVHARRATESALRVAVIVLLLAVSATWTLRAVGLHYNLTIAAAKNRDTWCDLPRWMRQNNWTPRDDPEWQFVLALQRQAVMMPVASAFEVYGYFGNRYFDQGP